MVIDDIFSTDPTLQIGQIAKLTKGLVTRAEQKFLTINVVRCAKPTKK